MIGQFSVETCPVSGVEVLQPGESRIRFRGAVLLVILLNVRIDGQLITLTDSLGDGTVGDAIVTPGVHAWSISNAADTAVLASGEIFCPECNPAIVTTPPTVPPGATVPPTDTLDQTGSATSNVLGILAGLFALSLVVTAITIKKPKRL